LLALRTYGHCLHRTGTRIATALILRTSTLSDMGALDKRLYTSPHASTDTVSRVGPDCVKLARNGCSLPNAARLSLPRHCTYQPHPCTVLTVAHHIHTRPPDVNACLAYPKSLSHTYSSLELRSSPSVRNRLEDHKTPPSTRTDSPSRLDWGVTTSLPATFFEGLFIRKAHTLYTLGTLFLSVFVI
jgi:hypothetical protein